MSPERPDRARGVFETLLVRDGRALALDAHLARLAVSARALYDLPLPEPAVATVRAQLGRLTQPTPGRGEQRARLEAEPRDGGLTLTLTVDGPPPPATPVALAPVVLAGGLGAHKWRDRRLIDALGADPVPLLCDAGDEVLEAAWGNVWLIEGPADLITPPTDGRILPGVTRARLLQAAPTLGLHTREETISLDRVRAADAVFLTSSLRLIVAAALGGAPAAPAPALHPLRAALARDPG